MPAGTRSRVEYAPRDRSKKDLRRKADKRYDPDRCAGKVPWRAGLLEQREINSAQSKYRKKTDEQVAVNYTELQELVFHSHYDRDADDRGNPRTGWALA